MEFGIQYYLISYLLLKVQDNFICDSKIVRLAACYLHYIRFDVYDL
jgi:hypothetical protein